MLFIRGVGWFRNRGALIWAAVGIALSGLAAWITPMGCEYTTIDGISIPLHPPWAIHTHEQAVFYTQLVGVLSVVAPPLLGLTLVLLTGVTWSRALRQERHVLALLLVPAFTSVLLLAEGAFQTVWPGINPEHPLVNLMLRVDGLLKPTLITSLVLIGFGLGALLARALSTRVRVSA